MTILGTWCLFTVLAGACNLVLSYKQKKRRFLVYSILLIVIGSIGLQMVRNTYDGIALPLSATQFATILTCAAALAVITTIRNVRFHHTHITPLSIQESFEKLTEGLCYYREGGQCILVNGRMQKISKDLTGHALLNGEEFSDFVFGKDGVRTGKILTLSDGSVKEFSEHKVVFEKEEATEIVAADITDLFEKTKRLQAENERLRAFQEKLLELHADQMDTVRREEILKAKMSIHDEMNRLLLSTRNAMQSEDISEKQIAILAWRSNALLLCREAQSAASVQEALGDLEVVAASLGIALSVPEMPTFAGEKALGLFVLATREAMVNAVKHADAKELLIRVRTETNAESPQGIGDMTNAGKPQGVCVIAYENDGRQPTEPVRETGGLANLRKRLEQAGGSMTVETQPRFCLTVRFPND